jgi:folate-binding protein YgfZ
MNLAMSGQWLPELGVLAARGPDARRFLQGQLSQDVLTLAPERVRLAGLHNPQGRTIALFWLVPEGSDDVLCITRRALVPSLLERLRRFVLRSKVQLTDESTATPALGVDGGDAEVALAALGLRFTATQPGALARPAGTATARGGLVAWRHPGGAHRCIVLNAPPGSLPTNDPDSADAWRAADIAAGLPHVEAATSEAFVAQMLNLDVLEGISFQKGCYTGQEVIARAHYRGRVKRRLQRFRSLDPVTMDWPAGMHGVLGDGRAFQVVDALRLADGRCEFLAVTALSAARDGAADAAQAAAAQPLPPVAPEVVPPEVVAPAVGSSAPIAVESLPLPYALPD